VVDQRLSNHGIAQLESTRSKEPRQLIDHFNSHTQKKVPNLLEHHKQLIFRRLRFNDRQSLGLMRIHHWRGGSDESAWKPTVAAVNNVKALRNPGRRIKLESRHSSRRQLEKNRV
jgi:hypothetical protein